MTGPSLGRRSVVSVGWNLAANAVAVAVLFARSVVLARLLPVEIFGIYAFATALAMVSVTGTDLGIGTAFLHRCRETEDEEAAAAVHFSVRAVLVALWAAVLVGVACVIGDAATRTALLVVVFATAANQLASTPRLILVRRVDHRRLAVLRVLNTVVASALAVGIALAGGELWALLSVDVATSALTVVTLFVWRPVWRPRFAWTRDIRVYYWRYGRTVFAASLLARGLDKLGDLWTASFLGQTALGFFSRASTFADYPRRVLAYPVNMVATGSYAELKGDRLRLSQTFFRFNFVLLRAAVLAAGLLAVLAPEMIRILLGERWLPMLPAFRLMLLYSAIEPIRSTVGELFPAVGHPEILLRVRALQLAVLAAGLVVLARPWGIVGVAVAVNLMSLTGMVVLLRRIRGLVDYSPWALFGPPAAAVGAAFAFSFATLEIALPGTSGVALAILRAAVFTVAYLSVLMVLERRRAGRVWKWLRTQMKERAASAEVPVP